jgi:hypothetical protein
VLVPEPPCPDCGRVHPGAILAAKRLWHPLIALLWGGFGSLVVLYATSPDFPAFTYATASLVLGVTASVVLLLHTKIALTDPNRNLERNLRRARQLDGWGLLEGVTDPDEDLALGPTPAVSRWSLPLLAVGAIGVLLSFSPFALKAASGWPEVGGTKPELVGPGDTVRVWFPQPIEAVDNRWNGTPRADVRVEGAAGATVVPATAPATTWDGELRRASAFNRRTRLWADVQLPDDPALAGKTVEVRVDMTVRYPVESGRYYEDVAVEVSTSQVFTLAGPGAADTYTGSLWLAGLGGFLVTACGVGLCLVAHRLRREIGWR